MAQDLKEPEAKTFSGDRIHIAGCVAHEQDPAGGS